MATEEGQVIACHNSQEFESHLTKGNDSKKLIVVDFTASWCGPCKVIAPVFAELAKKFTQILFLKVDVDEAREVAEKYDIQAMPTFIFLKEGKILETIQGARKEILSAAIEKHSAEPTVVTA